ncbi:MAG: ribonuclease PH [Chloroflexi bacterium]|nr:MAG: ribonuclease PH [Chloroflexota bacterium]
MAEQKAALLVPRPCPPGQLSDPWRRPADAYDHVRSALFVLRGHGAITETSRTVTGTATRRDARAPDQLRPLKIELGVNVHAEGSCLIEMGRTRVWITASVEDRVPMHRRGSGQGWITAEYSMLPRATHDRGSREAIQGRLGGRTHEIQRLIGRSLRAAVDMGKIGERTITLDCDVLQADGGTRTASITGAFVALYMAIKRMKDARMISEIPVRQHLAAVSCGIVDGTPLLDLDYSEDFHASTDLNSVMTEDGRLVELQATAEGAPYTRAELDSMLALAFKGIKELIVAQKRALATLA